MDNKESHFESELNTEAGNAKQVDPSMLVASIKQLRSNTVMQERSNNGTGMGRTTAM
jgi:hypothetical protein